MSGKQKDEYVNFNKLTPKNQSDWVQQNRIYLESRIDDEIIRLIAVHTDVDISPVDLRLDGEKQKLDKKGSIYYRGSRLQNSDGWPLVTFTITCFGSRGNAGFYPRDCYELINHEFERATGGDFNAAKSEAMAKARAERERKAKSKAQTEAERKAANVKQDIGRYGGLSNIPKDDQDAYLKAKQIDHSDINIFRFGTDKRGDFTAIKLFDVKSLANPQIRWLPIGIQRFRKTGACSVIGDIPPGNEAIKALYESRQNAPSHAKWTKIKPNYLGLPNFQKELNALTHHEFRRNISRRDKFNFIISEFANPHLKRLGLDEKWIADYSARRWLP